MKNRWIILLSVLLFSFADTFGQMKVVESSGKKPDWVGSLQSGFVIGTATAPTQKEAQQLAMASVRKQIVESVAVQISSVSKSLVQELMEGKESKMSSSYQRMTSTQTGKRDFLKGISPSRIEDTYWEKSRNKKTKEISYFYAVMYPFNRFDLEALVKEFEERDAELTRLLDEQVALTESFTAIEELYQVMAQLEELKTFFLDERKGIAVATIEKCKLLLKSVYLKGQGSQHGEVRYALFVGDRMVTTSTQPKVLSNCAEILNKDLGSKIVTIQYDDENCYDEPGNHIHVIYRFKGSTVDKKFPLDATVDEFELDVIGDLRIVGDILKIRFSSKFDKPVTITQIELNDVANTWSIDLKPQRTIEKSGTEVIALSVAIEDISFNNAEVNGYVYYTSENGERKTLRIYKRNLVRE